jgi:hypothetical protein
MNGEKHPLSVFVLFDEWQRYFGEMSVPDIYRLSIKMGVYPCNSALKKVDPPIMKKVPLGGTCDL